MGPPVSSPLGRSGPLSNEKVDSGATTPVFEVPSVTAHALAETALPARRASGGWPGRPNVDDAVASGPTMCQVAAEEDAWSLD